MARTRCGLLASRLPRWALPLLFEWKKKSFLIILYFLLNYLKIPYISIEGLWHVDPYLPADLICLWSMILSPSRTICSTPYELFLTSQLLLILFLPPFASSLFLSAKLNPFFKVHFNCHLLKEIYPGPSTCSFCNHCVPLQGRPPRSLRGLPVSCLLSQNRFTDSWQPKTFCILTMPSILSCT